MDDTPKYAGKDPDPVEFPVVVEFRFKSDVARRQFLGGLSDAWGENWCDMDRAFRSMAEPPSPGDACTVFVIASFPDVGGDDDD